MMRLFRNLLNKDKNKTPRRLAFAFLAFLIVAHPAPAYAILPTIDAANLAQSILNIMNWIEDHVIKSAGNLVQILVQKINSEIQIRGTQAVMDSNAYETRKQATLAASLPYIMPPGNGLCYTMSRTHYFSAMRDASAAMSDAMSDASMDARMGDSGMLAGAAEIKDLCDHSLYDTSGRFGSAAKDFGCKDPVYPNYARAYLRPKSLLSPMEYSVPAQTVAVRGKLVMPTADKTAPGEMPYVAAWYLCNQFRARLSEPPVVTGGKSTAEALRIARDQDSDRAAAQDLLDECSDELSRRARVPLAVSNLTAELAKQYQTEVAACNALHGGKPDPKTGCIPGGQIISDAEFNDCLQNGISELRYQWYMSCARHARPSSVAGTACFRPFDPTYTQTYNGGNDCEAFQRELHMNNARVSADLLAGMKIKPASDSIDLRQRPSAP